MAINSKSTKAQILAAYNALLEQHGELERAYLHLEAEGNYHPHNQPTAPSSKRVSNEEAETRGAKLKALRALCLTYNTTGRINTKTGNMELYSKKRAEWRVVPCAQ